MSHPLLHRTACDADLDRLVEIHLAAFPDARSGDVRRRNFQSNALGTLEDFHVLERDGVVVAHAFLYRLEGWFGGRLVQFGAIASVGVAPEHRGGGLGRQLVGELHRASHARGDALTILYPFRQGYYARAGYVPVTPTRRLEIAPESIPRAWETEPGLVREARGVDRPALVAAYEGAGARTTGWLKRPERLWDKLLLDERQRWSLLERGRDVVGYVRWELEQSEAHARTQLIVQELVCVDHAARRRLLAALGAMRDQVAAIVLETDADDPLDRALVDPDGRRHGTLSVEHTIGTLTTGPMVRVEDVARAVAARGYDERYEAGIVLEVESAGTFHVEARAGRAQATRTDHAPHLVVTKPALAGLLFGGLRVLDAVALGWLQVRDPEGAEAADALFAHPPFFSLDRF